MFGDCLGGLLVIVLLVSGGSFVNFAYDCWV